MDTFIWFVETTAIGLAVLAAIIAAVFSMLVAVIGTDGTVDPSRRLKLLVAGTRIGWLLVLCLTIGLLARL